MTTTVDILNESMDKLSELLDKTNKIAGNNEENIDKIMTESTEISKNMKKFSEKLNKRFLLLRLLF